MLPAELLAGCNVVLFEDERTGIELFPMAVLRPSWEIRTGAGCLRQWLTGLKLAGTPLLMRPRDALHGMAELLAGRGDDELDSEADTLFINGRLIGLWKTDESAPDLPDTLIDSEGRVLWARRRGADARELAAQGGTALAYALVQQVGGKLAPEGWRILHARYVWDTMLHNREVLERQLLGVGRGASELMGVHVLRELPAGVSLTDRTAGHPVYCGAGVRLMPGVVIGNHAGPVWIGSRADVEPHTYLEGPLYIGPDCRIKAGTRFYHGCSLGPYCRVAGELSASVLQGFVNKQHEGFLGNSVIGQWANLGADTRTSNLRNDYRNVRVKVGNQLVVTGEQFIGLMCGDHVKTGINTMFNTGTVVGVGANVFGAGYPPRFIPSFAEGGADKMEAGPLERILDAARMMMPRRGQELSDSEEQLLRSHYAETVKRETRS